MWKFSPERLAWVTLIVAQLVCLLIAGTSVVSARWFVFDSRVDLHTEIKVGRGTAGVRLASTGNEEAVRLNRNIAPRETVIIDPISQATIQFADTGDNDRVIANVTLFGSSQLKVVEANRPRFHLSDGQYEIVLDDFSGRVEVEIPTHLSRPMSLVVSSDNGAVTMTQAGFYIIAGTPNAVIVHPRIGTPELVMPDGRKISVITGYNAVADPTNNILYQGLSTDEIFDNPLFLSAVDDAPTPDGWGCEQGLNTDNAEYYLTTFEGRRSVYIKRVGQNLGPGVTLCKQFLGTNGANVIPYSSLRIRATFNVRSHSLSVCGIKATECVLMLRMYYKNEYGQDVEWIHGFYSFNYDPNNNPPIQCDTCLLAHEQVIPGNWFTYESSNLMNLPEGRRPTTITRIEFYASGHAYEVAVAEVALIGER